MTDTSTEAVEGLVVRLMQPGRALQQTWVGGEPDFPGDEHASTFSAGGPGKMTDCWKCPQCGRSLER